MNTQYKFSEHLRHDGMKNLHHIRVGHFNYAVKSDKRLSNNGWQIVILSISRVSSTTGNLYLLPAHDVFEAKGWLIKNLMKELEKYDQQRCKSIAISNSNYYRSRAIAGAKRRANERAEMKMWGG